jgi:hypothetical protein
MDASQILSGSVGAAIVASIYGLGKLIQVINHKRVKSSCCGKKIEASFDIEQTIPSPQPKENPPLTLREIKIDIPTTNDAANA